MTKLIEYPRRQGGLCLAEDGLGKYLSCMQCGYLRDVEKPAPELEPTAIGPQEDGREAARPVDAPTDFLQPDWNITNIRAEVACSG